MLEVNVITLDCCKCLQCILIEVEKKKNNHEAAFASVNALLRRYPCFLLTQPNKPSSPKVIRSHHFPISLEVSYLTSRPTSTIYAT